MEPADQNNESEFSRNVSEMEKRKLKALREKKSGVWAGLGMFGMVGWSVTVPALLGAAAGIWLDRKFPQSFSWTLTLLIAGLSVGCVIGGYWVTKEDSEMHKKN
ncbi:AtpZ/AtpI family protein [Dyadobacter frigoris]|uniref:ATP synthase subunit n=1 Tax=Dyadobacter frigoris TaxID=2576211 RepID=A0A4U6D2J2_9BACT|nr:AtpZ/AtpI family protein [Dyadobacter frigoris]TKT90377.1 ATP synthase subunit [Dyadobacter frigoris]GLU57291.1 F0F1 ATP synthase subunit [Dyadobacter frigoris]